MLYDRRAIAVFVTVITVASSSFTPVVAGGGGAFGPVSGGSRISNFEKDGHNNNKNVDDDDLSIAVKSILKKKTDWSIGKAVAKRDSAAQRNLQQQQQPQPRRINNQQTDNEDAFASFSLQTALQIIRTKMGTTTNNKEGGGGGGSFGGGVCLSATSVNFTASGDEFSALAFDDEFVPQCTCVETNNFEELQANIPEPTEDFDDFLQTLNQILSDITGSYQYNCTINCETCLDSGDCGLLGGSKYYEFSSTPTDFTLDDLLSGAFEQFDFTSLIVDEEFDFKHCITYTSGQTGKICLGVDLTEQPIKGEDFDCFLTINDQACASCIVDFTFPFNKECLKADCTNVVTHSVPINVCKDEGTTGIFQFLDFYYDEDVTGLTLDDNGNCNVDYDKPCEGLFPCKNTFGSSGISMEMDFLGVFCFSICVSYLPMSLMELLGFSCGSC